LVCWIIVKMSVGACLSLVIRKCVALLQLRSQLDIFQLKVGFEPVPGICLWNYSIIWIVTIFCEVYFYYCCFNPTFSTIMFRNHIFYIFTKNVKFIPLFLLYSTIMFRIHIFYILPKMLNLLKTSHYLILQICLEFTFSIYYQKNVKSSPFFTLLYSTIMFRIHIFYISPKMLNIFLGLMGWYITVIGYYFVRPISSYLLC
jgi:hypothetical protein